MLLHHRLRFFIFFFIVLFLSESRFWSSSEFAIFATSSQSIRLIMFILFFVVRFCFLSVLVAIHIKHLSIHINHHHISQFDNETKVINNGQSGCAKKKIKCYYVLPIHFLPDGHYLSGNHATISFFCRFRFLFFWINICRNSRNRWVFESLLDENFREFNCKLA